MLKHIQGIHSEQNNNNNYITKQTAIESVPLFVTGNQAEEETFSTVL